MSTTTTAPIAAACALPVRTFAVRGGRAGAR